MKAINRRKAISLVTVSAFTLISGSLFAEKKKKKNENKKKKKKKNDNPNKKKKEENSKPKKLSGEIKLIEEKISLTYKLVGAKTYSFSKTLENKIIQFKDQKVILTGVVDGDRIITIESIKAAKSS